MNKMSKNNIPDFPDVQYVPISVLQDVDKRISDYLASGGKETDSYIQRQMDYLEKVNNLVERINKK